MFSLLISSPLLDFMYIFIVLLYLFNICMDTYDTYLCISLFIIYLYNLIWYATVTCGDSSDLHLNSMHDLPLSSFEKCILCAPNTSLIPNTWFDLLYFFSFLFFSSLLTSLAQPCHRSVLLHFFPLYSYLALGIFITHALTMRVRAS